MNHRSGPSISRRELLAAGAMLAAAPQTSAADDDLAAPFTVDDQRPFRGQTRQLKITRGKRPVAALVFPTDYPTHFRLKPELAHVCTPSGVPVTGSHEYCFIHHQSIMCGHGRVQRDGDPDVVDFYRQLPFADDDRSDRWHSPDRNLFRLGPSGIQRVVAAAWRDGAQAIVRLELQWQTRRPGAEQGDTLLVEERIYRIGQQGPATIVDVSSRLEPADRPVTLWPENDHGYLGVRVHDLIDVLDGGTMTDSEGRTNPTEHFRDAEGERRIPRWADCTGRLGNAEVGMALMGHPGNPRNEWYLREFGLMIVSAAQSQAVRITSDAPFEFMARFVAHDGPLPAAQAEPLWTAFAALSPSTLRQLAGTPA